MEILSRFRMDHPGVFFLQAQDPAQLVEYLHARRWWQEGEHLIALEKPGAGNMNCVLRVITNQRSFVVKQARPWVEKYPQIDAPVIRASTEAKFYQCLDNIEGINRFVPEFLFHDPESFLLILEDLGESADFTYLYQKGKNLTTQEVEALAQFLTLLHRYELSPKDFPENLEMRKLNHEHLFLFPFREENGFDLDTVQPGLQAASMPYKQNERLKSRIESLGDVYMSHGPFLLHGDYYPGSWLNSPSGLKVIDPEFGYPGYPEFDLGVCMAHLLLAQQTPEVVCTFRNAYQAPKALDEDLLVCFTGMEVFRRLIGIAQLPLMLSLEEKIALMDKAASAVQTGKLGILIPECA